MQGKDGANQLKVVFTTVLHPKDRNVFVVLCVNVLIRNAINFESVASLAIETVQLLHCQTGVLNADKSIPLAKWTDELYVAVRFVFHFIFIRQSIFTFHLRESYTMPYWL